MLYKGKLDELIEWRKSQKNGNKIKKYNQGNSNNKIKPDDKGTKKMISATMASDLS